MRSLADSRDRRIVACLLTVGVVQLFVWSAPLAHAEETEVIQQSFDRDPKWEQYRIQILPEKLPLVRQNFGYRRSQHAGGRTPGEIGGTIQRSATLSRYSKSIPVKTLNDRLSASGKFAVTGGVGGSGVMFGWFNTKSRGWRTPNSLAFRIDGNGGDRFWVFYEYGTRNRRTGGGGAFEGERYQTTPTPPFPADGTVHQWSLNYDPQGSDGSGEITFQIDDRVYRVPLLPGHKADGAEFDRFGIWNVQTSADSIDVFFDDLVIDGQREDFTTDPNWKGENNVVQFRERVVRPFHNFGFQDTAFAGGKPGEIGGIVFRDEKPAYFGRPIAKLTLDDAFSASGKVALRDAGADSGVFLGWFNGGKKRRKSTPEHEERQTDYVGVMVEGPSRTGHYFRAAYSNSDGRGGAPFEVKDADNRRPVILPDGEVHDWKISYDPAGGDGNGRITVQFDKSIHTLDLRPEERAAGAVFDRFGLFNMQSGGHHVEIYFDDLTITRGRND